MTTPPKVFIFLPQCVKKSNSFFLFGDAELIEENNIVVFYVFDLTGRAEAKPLGIWTEFEQISIEITNYDTYIHLLKNSKGEIILEKLKFEGKEKNLKEFDENIIIFYDVASFQDFQDERGCLFGKLQCKLTSLRCRRNYKKMWALRIVTLLALLSSVLEKLMPMLKYSSICVQLKSSINRFLWAFESVQKHERWQVKVGNLFLSVLLDVVIGVLCLKCLTTLSPTEDFPGLFLFTCEKCVTWLRETLEWLAGSPAGFKLNRQFNNILAKFFIFHTDIWWLFLVFISPGLRIAFQVFVFLGQFGVTYQAAILSDMLALVSFHAYCIYAYAARLYNIQLSGLISLWRLFLGRKWNPLRQKVDSCHYSADQLFVGTLVFTILLFLLPTTLTYYIVFTASRLVIVAVGGLLTRVRIFLHAVPVYSTMLWLIAASSVRLDIRIDPDSSRSSAGVLVLNARRVPASYLTTVKNTVPDCIQVPPAWPKSLIRTLLVGELLYPV